MERRAATPAGTARAEDPGLSAAREAAEAVPAEINLSSFISILKEKRLQTNTKNHGVCLQSERRIIPCFCIIKIVFIFFLSTVKYKN
ncbi:hypothetical protein ACA30_03890 [Virgibacillus soli]|uniref:Uncharacterized protein n=1 Tax=Lederbergia galactosidilytica TaxID=217031 RepID=A0A177ZYK1_9BACI|nr:hypothetical protein ACA30_03890 [Virgibacillus soli]OAK72971.1 hypothetical protein ABB05_06990 [Lederbergia galactosidilytica]